VSGGPDGDPDTDIQAWIRDFVVDVLAGHAGKTMELVSALRRDSNKNVVVRLAVKQIKASLDLEDSAASRNRLLRGWLAEHRDDVVASWKQLGFPMPAPMVCMNVESVSGKDISAAPTAFDAAKKPARGESTFTANRRSRQPPGCSFGSTKCIGAAVFDFDQTLAVRHVSVFEDMIYVADRIFGGEARVEMLRTMFDQLRGRSIIISVVTRNARHVIRKTLGAIGLLRYVAEDLIFGFEDYDDDIPKSSVVRDRVLPALDLIQDGVLFVDDDGGNIRDMEANCPRAKCLQAPKSGITSCECALILDWAANLVADSAG